MAAAEGDDAAAAPPAQAEPKLTAKEKREAAEAFSERLNATPAKCSEADRFRNADDRLKGLKADAVAAVRTACESSKDAPLAPELSAVLESWCVLQGESPVSVARCGELAADPSEFFLVGMSLIGAMSPEERADISSRLSGVTADAVRALPCPAADTIATMAEWLQAGIALQQWADELQKTAAEKK
eukprot:TRINITY_DN71512_c0_g1_i1.p2 TRINITY_DN71512_c0_g1~~TRINITY_DN71512_c0_g1_i1.p2  ORF type:complete len:214 (+),score=58.02 TRINITY_DN71512_c0_g1_i1:85-642(+)